MEFNVSSAELLKGMMDVSKAVPVKSALPILEYFLFELRGNTLRITASDQELTLRTEVEVDAKEDGSIAAPASQLIALFKALPDQPVSIRTTGESSFECVWGNGNSSLPFFPAADFPEIKGVTDEAQSIVFPAESLIEGISSTIYATADDEMRPAMNGIFFDMTPDNTTLVASDS
ncbi:MAG: DNA polymerase III subunit beta, partial [Bacteroidales bacterium]|nr:DNA polymerase III subunit beta [Bacteroidales bacterium]